MVKVLVTGAGALLGQGIIRSLRWATLPARIIAVDPNPHAAGLVWADVSEPVPLAGDPGYIDCIERILARESPDVLMVGTDVELAVFARERNRLEAQYGTRILVSDPEVIEIADDKWRTAEFLRNSGLFPPQSCLPGDEDALIDAVGFPLIVKPRRGARSVGVSVVGDRRQLAAAIAAGTDVVIQELVGTDEEEFTAGVLCFDGECSASIVMRRTLRDGNTYTAQVEDFPEFNAGVRAIARVLRPHGPANFQFRADGLGIRVFEINARFSGTTPLRALAGFNEVEMCLRYLLEGERVRQPPVEAITILRHWSETVVRSPRA